MSAWAALLALPLAALLVYSVFSAFKYTRMISNIFLGLVYNPAPEEALSATGEKISILDSSDREIEALYAETKGAKRIVIFCHESGSGHESWEKYAYFLPKQGYHVLSVGFSGCGEESEMNSLSQWPTQEEVEKLVTVIRWAKKALQPNLIVLFGVSKGANLALAASVRETAVSAVISDGLFSMKEIFRDYIRRWAPVLVKPNLFGDSYPAWVVNIFTELGFWHCQKRSRRCFVDVEALLKKKHAPLLMIHGEEDDYVPPSHQRHLGKLRKAVTDGHFIAPQAGHNKAVVSDRQAYEAVVTKFLENVLPK